MKAIYNKYGKFVGVVGGAVAGMTVAVLLLLLLTSTRLYQVFLVNWGLMPVRSLALLISCSASSSVVEL